MTLLKHTMLCLPISLAMLGITLSIGANVIVNHLVSLHAKVSIFTFSSLFVEHDHTPLGLGELHLDGFQIYWDDPQQKGHLASISFRAADAGTRTRFTRNAQPEEETKVCVIRACLSSSSFNDAALIYCADDFGWTTTPPSPYQVSRARKLVIPVLAEHGPFWNVEDSGSGTEEPELNIAYPWHAWCAGSSQPEGKCSKAQNRTVWMVVEFPNVPDYAEDEEHRKLGSCLIC